ncbi:hypothetical protein GCM10027051_08730 [Niabella terrae]
MKQLTSIIPTLLLCSVFFYGRSQTFSNRLEGRFEAAGGTALYQYFIFDGKGSVDIMGFNDGYYFQKDDTLIVFPDKSLFKFLVRNDTLVGVSSWVDSGRWVLKSCLGADPLQIDTLEGDRMASLLNDYYELTNSGSWSFLFNNDGSYEQALRKLCVEGLTKACLDYVGLKILSDIGMYPANATIANKKRRADPHIIELLEAVIAKGDKNGYMVLGGYWASLGDATKAKAVLEEGMDEGCKKCGLTLISIAMQETPLPPAQQELPKTRKARVRRVKR